MSVRHFNSEPREATISEYHLYLINDLGHVRGRFVLQCRSDDDALSMVERHRDGRDMELWQGERLVRRLPHAEKDVAA